MTRYLCYNNMYLDKNIRSKMYTIVLQVAINKTLIYSYERKPCIEPFQIKISDSLAQKDLFYNTYFEFAVNKFQVL